MTAAVAPVMRALRRRSLEETPTDHLIRRIRWHRAVKHANPPGSAAWRAADVRERCLIAVLHRRFGVTTITPDGLDWLILWEHQADRPA
jgi:hypothetical protein